MSPKSRKQGTWIWGIGWPEVCRIANYHYDKSAFQCQPRDDVWPFEVSPNPAETRIRHVMTGLLACLQQVKLPYEMFFAYCHRWFIPPLRPNGVGCLRVGTEGTPFTVYVLAVERHFHDEIGMLSGTDSTTLGGQFNSLMPIPEWEMWQ